MWAIRRERNKLVVVKPYTQITLSSFQLHDHVITRLFKLQGIFFAPTCMLVVKGVLAVETLALVAAASIVLLALAVTLEALWVLAVAPAARVGCLNLLLQVAFPQLRIILCVSTPCAGTDIRGADLEPLEAVAVHLGTAILVAAAFELFNLDRACRNRRLSGLLQSGKRNVYFSGVHGAEYLLLAQVLLLTRVSELVTRNLWYIILWNSYVGACSV